ncbi:MAG: hypothetical protein SGPRY_014354, partial [Prymnesium sp.]
MLAGLREAGTGAWLEGYKRGLRTAEARGRAELSQWELSAHVGRLLGLTSPLPSCSISSVEDRLASQVAGAMDWWGLDPTDAVISRDLEAEMASRASSQLEPEPGGPSPHSIPPLMERSASGELPRGWWKHRYETTLRELSLQQGVSPHAPHVLALARAEHMALASCVRSHYWAATSHGGVVLASTQEGEGMVREPSTSELPSEGSEGAGSCFRDRGERLSTRSKEEMELESPSSSEHVSWSSKEGRERVVPSSRKGGEKLSASSREGRERLSSRDEEKRSAPSSCEGGESILQGRREGRENVRLRSRGEEKRLGPSSIKPKDTTLTAGPSGDEEVFGQGPSSRGSWVAASQPRAFSPSSDVLTSPQPVSFSSSDVLTLWVQLDANGMLGLELYQSVSLPPQ